ncbi:MAG: DEAD/DEAH box helicase [Candidatus Omnitrophica bacterium]|nr:DEAD/DEAH box helicase [Candidatus Omnitrophota bacterium]
MKYDPFQQKAIDHINDGFSVIVSAPTGAGKTAIAEHVIRRCLERREKVIYTSPIKALSNQKYRDFSEDYPEQVGILTGDVSINQNAPTLIMTTEIFRNKILDEQSTLKDYTWIIFDEIHYLDDLERGSVWEESLIFLPDHMNILGLSATIPNLDQLAQWLQTIHHRPIKVVKEDNRPVPLHFFFQCQGQIYDNFKKLKYEGFRTIDWYNHDARRVPKSVSVKPNRPTDLIKHLKTQEALPCIFFTFSRIRTEYLAGEMKIFDLLTPDEKVKIKNLFQQLCHRFEILHEPSTYDIMPLVEKGIAYHHAGMLPTLKEVVERLFTTRLIKVIFTTETFALGVNMPARSVIFDEMRKYYERGFRPLKTRDFYQMAGRAGRRSIDKEGYVFCRVNPHDLGIEELKHIIEDEPEKVLSRFNASYATLLNLYEKYGEKLYEIYPFSFHHFQVRKGAQKKAVATLRAKVTLLKQLGHIRKNKLTEKGTFAAKVYGYELLFSELYHLGMLEQLPPEKLGVLCLAMCYEPRKGMRKPKLNYQTQQLQILTNDLIFPIHKMERKAGLAPLSKSCYFHLSPCLEDWMKGENFNQITEYTSVDEGEIVRYFRMTIQLLRELLETNISKKMNETIYKVIGKMNRGVIDAEKQLRS